MKQQKKGVIWWVVAILAPLGVLGGALSFAQLMQGVLSYNSFLDFLVDYWSDKIAEPIRDSINYILSLLPIPEISIEISNWVVLGFTSYLSIIRAMHFRVSIFGVIPRRPRIEAQASEKGEDDKRPTIIYILIYGVSVVYLIVRLFIFGPVETMNLIDWVAFLIVIGGIILVALAAFLYLWLFFIGWPLFLFMIAVVPLVMRILVDIGVLSVKEDGFYNFHDGREYFVAAFAFAQFGLFFVLYILDQLFSA